MGLLISGADMPKSCGLCPCVDEELKLCRAGKVERKIAGRHTPRPDWCPLSYYPDEEVQMSVYDQEEIHPNCTVQVWANSFTGDVSIGWWDNEEAE